MRTAAKRKVAESGALSPQQIADLRARIQEYGLEAAEALILANAAPCYAALPTRPEDYAAIGNTRFGGVPDLAPDEDWPSDSYPGDPEARFSNFLAQIQLADVPLLSGGKGGLLYLFFADELGGNLSLNIDAGWFAGDSARCQRAAAPPDRLMREEYLTGLRPLQVRFAPAISLPLCRRAFQEALEATIPGGLARAVALQEALEEGTPRIGQLLGYANCADTTLDLGQKVGLASRVDEWRLLLCLDSNYQMDFWINETASLYIFIRSNALASGDFSHLLARVAQR